jgi:succinate dehydrogenase / fumarate reductase cytochrome b subunit
MAGKRPKYLELTRIRLPLPGIVSILHRISGAALFLFLPFLIWLLQSSLTAPESFERYQAAVAHPLVKLVLIGLLWAFLHHLFAGIRFLLLDIHLGTELAAARGSSRVVLAAGVLLAVALGVWLW